MVLIDIRISGRENVGLGRREVNVDNRNRYSYLEKAIAKGKSSRLGQ